MTSSLIGKNNKFEYSGEPCQLEFYKCFHDPSSSEMLTGKELLNLEKKPYWTDEHRQIWQYFYRPYNYGNNIGKNQRKEKNRRESVVEECRTKISSYKRFIYISQFFIVIAFIFSIVYVNVWLVVIPIISYIYFYFQNISLLSDIETNTKIIKVLEAEISYLLKKKDEISEVRLSSSEIESLFWKDINNLEESYIKKAHHDDSDNIRGNAPNFYKNVRVELIENHQFPTFPVIPSWALLQPSQRSSNNRVNQATGIKIAANEIGKRVATWRAVKGKRPIFRLWYIQFLFFHEKNLSLMSFYYDFVTKITYSEHIESYQYNHITNYSYTDEDITYMKDDPLIKEVKLPENLTNNIFGSQVKTISLESASGSFYRCVLPDSDVTNGLNEWIQYKHSEENIEKDDKSEYGVEIKAELFKNLEEYESLIENLAWLSFKQLRETVAKFSLSETENS